MENKKMEELQVADIESGETKSGQFDIDHANKIGFDPTKENVKPVFVELSVENKGLKEEATYQDKFKGLMAQYGIKTIAELPEEKKSEFFKKADEMHISKEEMGLKEEVKPTEDNAAKQQFDIEAANEVGFNSAKEEEYHELKIEDGDDAVYSEEELKEAFQHLKLDLKNKTIEQLAEGFGMVTLTEANKNVEVSKLRELARATSDKVVSASVAFLSNKQLDRLIDTGYSEAKRLTKTASDEVKKYVFGRVKQSNSFGVKKEKVNYIRTLFSKAPKDRIETTAKKIKSKINQELKKVDTKKYIGKKSVTALQESVVGGILFIFGGIALALIPYFVVLITVSVRDLIQQAGYNR